MGTHVKQGSLKWRWGKIGARKRSWWSIFRESEKKISPGAKVVSTYLIYIITFRIKWFFGLEWYNSTTLHPDVSQSDLYNILFHIFLYYSMFPLSKTLKGLIEKCYYFYLSVLPTYPGVLRKGEKAEVLFIQGTAHQEYTRSVSYTHLRAHETDSYLVCRLLLEKKVPNLFLENFVIF